MRFIYCFCCWALLIDVLGPAAPHDAADGCEDCIDQHAGNCYHSSWPGKSYDKCSKEKTETKCNKNDGGVWCLTPSRAERCCQHCKHGGHCHNHCNTTTTKAQCKTCAKHERLQWCTGGEPVPPPPGPSGGGLIALKDVTFYGFPDNCPPSAQPHSNGTGTYDDPITFAGAPSAIKHGTIMYIAHYRKYFIMDDECEECEQDWKRDGTYHVDLWLGPTHMDQNYTRLVGCEDAMSDGKAKTGMLNPAANLAVDTTPFYDAERDRCMNNAEPCHETCDPHVECNECDGLSGSCEAVAKVFSLSVECFQKLNPNVNCSSEKALHGQTFCQGSGCPLHNVSSRP